MKNRPYLEKELAIAMDSIKINKSKTQKLKEALLAYSIFPGDTQKYINQAESELPQMDLRLLCLVTEQVYKLVRSPALNPKLYFTEIEIKKSKQYSGNMAEEDKLELPLTFDHVIMLDEENYITVIDIQLIRKLFKSKLIEYNFETQREARFVKTRDTIQKVAKVNSRSVKEITQRLLQGELSPTTVTFNAQLHTAEEGEELLYNPGKMQLTITKGTELDILDGYHRILGSLNALEINPDLRFYFQLAIKNYNIAQAQRHLAEISKVNVIDKTHMEALAATRYADTVVKHLQRESDLKGRISQTGRIHSRGRELVSYNVLADTIEEEFNMNSKRDALDVAAYLTRFFDYLLGSFTAEFMTDVEQVGTHSLINQSSMFAGYIVLAKRLQDERISYTYLDSILRAIDFSRSNPLWAELGIAKDGVVTAKARQHIKAFFKKIDLEEMKVGMEHGK